MNLNTIHYEAAWSFMLELPQSFGDWLKTVEIGCPRLIRMRNVSSGLSVHWLVASYSGAQLWGCPLMYVFLSLQVEYVPPSRGARFPYVSCLWSLPTAML